MSAPQLLEEIDGLADLDLPALRLRWLELHGSAAPLRMSREVLVQAIAYRLQERAFGGFSPSALARLSGSRQRAELCVRVERSVKAGTRFVREWRGRTIQVIADASGGYLHRGQAYRSLSAIAREVTGARWSGPPSSG